MIYNRAPIQPNIPEVEEENENESNTNKQINVHGSNSVVCKVVLCRGIPVTHERNCTQPKAAQSFREGS
jgi:hypothetical protein